MRLCCLLLLLFTSLFCLTCQDNNSTLIRKRRYLVFPTNARGGIRVNFKHNRVVPITNILAYSDGVRLTWDLPTKLKDFKPNYGIFGRRSIQRREIFEFVEAAINGNGLNGEACVLRAMCEAAVQVQPASGLIKKILHRMFTVPDDEINGLNTAARELLKGNLECTTRFAHHCPFSLLGPSSSAPFHETHPRD